MFTGIIQQIGTIQNLEDRDGNTFLTIASPMASSKKVGDSIAIDGCCLTVLEGSNEHSFIVEAVQETLQHTIIKNYQKATRVNLENPLKAGDGLDGHMVQGHVDFVGKIKKVVAEGMSRRVSVSLPHEMAKYVALKGSITINGTSLTVSNLGTNDFEVTLIPQTIETNNLGTLTEGSEVNIEIDVISRYLEKLLQDKEKETTYQFLQERGFI